MPRAWRRRFVAGCGALLLAAVVYVGWALVQGEPYWECKLGRVLCYVSDRPDLTNDAGCHAFWGAVRRAHLYLELAAGVDPWMVDDVHIAWVAPGRAQTIVVRFSTSPEQVAKIARRGIPLAPEELDSFLRTGVYSTNVPPDVHLHWTLAYLGQYPFNRLRWWPPKGGDPNDLEPYLVTVPPAGTPGSPVPRWAGVMVIDSERGLVWIAGPYLGKPWREATPPDPDPGRRTEAVPAPRASASEDSADATLGRCVRIRPGIPGGKAILGSAHAEEWVHHSDCGSQDVALSPDWSLLARTAGEGVALYDSVAGTAVEWQVRSEAGSEAAPSPSPQTGSSVRLATATMGSGSGSQKSM